MKPNKEKTYVPTVRINGRETVDRGEYLEYTGNDIIDLEIAKHNIGRFLYKYMEKVSCISYNIPMMTSYAVEVVGDMLYDRALLNNPCDGIDYIKILANRISVILELNGRAIHSIKEIAEFLYTQKREVKK